MILTGMKNKIINIIDLFKDQEILVIGDVMLDRYIWGDVSRISPEAPVQVVNVEKEENALGGAANVANNITSLCGTAFLVGIIGNDISGRTLKMELQKRDIITDHLITDMKRPTIQKMRVIARNQQLLRVDYDTNKEISVQTFEKVIAIVRQLIQQVGVIIISDYGKGIITKNLMEKIITLSVKKKKFLIVDPKPKNVNYYKGCSIVIPNHHEASQMTKIEEKTEEDLVKIGETLKANLDCDVLITRGEKGMTLFKKDESIKSISTKAKEVYDVTGAGDTVAASLSLALSNGASLEEASVIANHAAGIVVGKVGTSTVSIKELKTDMENRRIFFGDRSK